MLKFTILSENRNTENFQGEGGLSIYIEIDDEKILLDTGYSSLFLENAKKLNINIDDVDTIVLTHGHSDHTNGVPYLNPNKTIIMHPEGFKTRYSIRKKEYVGFPTSKEELEKKHKVVLSKDALQIKKNIFFLGEIPMIIDFETGNFSTTLDDAFTQKDLTEDDSGIAIKTEEGLIIMTGCGHRGICNTIEKAKEITNEKRIYAVLGGFHLRNLEKQKNMIDKTIEYFEKEQVKHLYLGHCVTDEVINYFKESVQNIEIHNLATGLTFQLERSKTKTIK